MPSRWCGGASASVSKKRPSSSPSPPLLGAAIAAVSSRSAPSPSTAVPSASSAARLTSATRPSLAQQATVTSNLYPPSTTAKRTTDTGRRLETFTAWPRAGPPLGALRQLVALHRHEILLLARQRGVDPLQLQLRIAKRPGERDTTRAGRGLEEKLRVRKARVKVALPVCRAEQDCTNAVISIRPPRNLEHSGVVSKASRGGRAGCLRHRRRARGCAGWRQPCAGSARRCRTRQAASGPALLLPACRVSGSAAGRRRARRPSWPPRAARPCR